jgi:hypothetical protein
MKRKEESWKQRKNKRKETFAHYIKADKIDVVKRW